VEGKRRGEEAAGGNLAKNVEIFRREKRGRYSYIRGIWLGTLAKIIEE
jgi:hypothetical protein